MIQKFFTLQRNAYFLQFIRLKSYKVVVVGGGSGGISVASKFKSLNKNQLAIVEPKDKHYYQPLFTLVGGGIKNLSDTYKPMNEVIPKNADWIQKKVKKFVPEKNTLILNDDTDLKYDYLIISIGLQLDFNKIKGLSSLNLNGICSNYSPDTVEKTWKNISTLKEGNAIFTFPNSPVKCPGAPQKIIYLADEYFRKNGVREKINIIYNTTQETIFAVRKYAKTLEKLVKEKNINVNFRHNLIEVIPDKNEAIFENIATKEKKKFHYNLLHITPPQKPSKVLLPLADESGFVKIDKNTLQHFEYKNIFALGDCSNLPTSKTGAAVASQSNILVKNLNSLMNNKDLTKKYQGYTSCPLITGYGKCILAEFDYNLKPLETFPFDQSKERKSMYYLKKDVIPFIYWNFMLKGNWKGPDFMRKLLRLGLSK